MCPHSCVSLSLYFFLTHTLTDIAPTTILVIKNNTNVKRFTLESEPAVASPSGALAFRSYLDGSLTRQGHVTLKLSRAIFVLAHPQLTFSLDKMIY